MGKVLKVKIKSFTGNTIAARNPVKLFSWTVIASGVNLALRSLVSAPQIKLWVAHLLATSSKTRSW